MAHWDSITSRGNIDDRRGSPARVAGSIGLGTIALVALVNYALTGTVDVQTLAQQLQEMQSTAAPQENSAQYAGLDSYEQFASTVLGSTNDAWHTLFANNGASYTPPHFVLFRGATQSACGGAYAQVGPHYCPEDETIYLDETFFDELRDTYGASGDVAQAYVIAHEVGHHVQTVLGIEKDSIAMELQADCFAGIWAHSIKDAGVFEQGEIKEAIDAASAVGDDHIQEIEAGYVQPETWTHGSSAQRVHAFTTGYTTGDMRACDAHI